MKKLGEALKGLFKVNKKSIIRGSIIVVGVVAGVLIITYLVHKGGEEVTEVIEIVVDGTEEALEGIEEIVITTLETV